MNLLLRTSRILLFTQALKKENITLLKGPLFRTKRPQIIALIRERDEELIIKDTLDELGAIADGIIVFDDKSNDRSIEIARSHPSVIAVLASNEWRPERAPEETRHRRILHEFGKLYKPDWFFYSDCDERFEGDIRTFLLSDDAREVQGVRISLFDAYLTENDHDPYISGKLYDLRKKFGPERRDILMIWRNLPAISYGKLDDMREPLGFNESDVITKFSCQHYGKSLSIEHWEATCDYYINNFPGYAEKWKQRKGKAIHTSSDQGNLLYTWAEAKKHFIKMWPKE